MKRILLFILSIHSLFTFSQTGTKNFIDQNYIEVTGKAEMEVVPNEINLRILINEKDFKNKTSLVEIEKSMLNKLTEIGIDISKQLAIKDMTSNFRNYWLKSSTINATKEYQLTVSDAKTVGKVFQELESLGISNISITTIEHSEIQEFKKSVKINAIKAAKVKAKSLINAIDQEIGKAIYVKELNNHVYGTFKRKEANLSNISIKGYLNENTMKLEPKIEFEKIKLEYSILVRFEIAK